LINKCLLYFTSHVSTYNSAILWGTIRYLPFKKTINYSDFITLYITDISNYELTMCY